MKHTWVNQEIKTAILQLNKKSDPSIFSRDCWGPSYPKWPSVFNPWIIKLVYRKARPTINLKQHPSSETGRSTTSPSAWGSSECGPKAWPRFHETTGNSSILPITAEKPVNWGTHAYSLSLGARFCFDSLLQSWLSVCCVNRLRRQEFPSFCGFWFLVRGRFWRFLPVLFVILVLWFHSTICGTANIYSACK